MNEQSKIHALCFNTKTGQIYIYPNRDLNIKNLFLDLIIWDISLK